MFDEMQCRAYANGALDGYNCGVENNPYDTEENRYAYRLGYDYGVAMYYQDNHPEDEATE